MIADGLVEEARSVYPLRHLNSLNTVGYKEMFAYFDARFTLRQATDRMAKTPGYMQKTAHMAQRNPTSNGCRQQTLFKKR